MKKELKYACYIVTPYSYNLLIERFNMLMLIPSLYRKRWFFYVSCISQQGYIRWMSLDHLMWPENGLLQIADINNCVWKMCFARQAKQAVTKCNVDQVLWRPMASLGHNHNVLNTTHVWWYNKQQNQNARDRISTSLISVTHVTRSQNPKGLKKRPKPCVCIFNYNTASVCDMNLILELILCSLLLIYYREGYDIL